MYHCYLFCFEYVTNIVMFKGNKEFEFDNYIPLDPQRQYNKYTMKKSKIAQIEQYSWKTTLLTGVWYMCEIKWYFVLVDVVLQKGVGYT